MACRITLQAIVKYTDYRILSSNSINRIYDIGTETKRPHATPIPAAMLAGTSCTAAIIMTSSMTMLKASNNIEIVFVLFSFIIYLSVQSTAGFTCTAVYATK